MSAGTKQIYAMLGKLVTHADCFSNWTVADVQAIFKKPKEAIEDWRQMITNDRRKIIIPTSNRTDSAASFHLTVGEYTNLLSLYEKTTLCSPEVTKFDHLSRHLILSDKIFHRSVFSVREENVGFKVMTLNDFGFQDHPETGDFMNDEFLEAWSRKHYGNRTLSLCRDTDFIFFASHAELGFNIGSSECVIFAAEPVQHFSSGGLYIFAVRAIKLQIIRDIFTIAAHRERTYPLTQKFVFRITPNEPKTRSKGK